jgi:D-glutamate N-acetyltransferase
MPRDPRFLILADGLFGPETSKTANACIRYTPEHVVGIIDATRAGRRAQDVIGFGGDIPIVASLDEGLALRPNALLVGIAPAGGKLPAEWILLLARAIEHGLEIWSGLHTFIADVPELAALAAKHRVPIHDLRRPPARLDVARGRVRNIDATVVLTVGTDCNIGKMTTQLQILDAVRAKGIRTAFAATGQTGILIEGRGIAVDAVVADFIAGAAESLVLESARDADLVLVEGQGSIIHPSYSGVTYGLMHGALPHAQVMCAQPSRRAINGCEWVKIPPLPDFIRMSEAALVALRPAPVIAVALNTFDLDDDAARRAIETVEQETGLPTTDPVRFDPAPIVDAIATFHEARRVSA